MHQQPLQQQQSQQQNSKDHSCIICQRSLQDSTSLYCSIACKDFVDVSGPTQHWVFTFRRPLFDWEKSELLRLTTTLYPTPTLNLEAQDSAVWSEAIAGQSLVSVFYNHTSIAHGACNYPIRLVWNKHLPPKVQFFSWLAWKYKLKTSVFLQRIGILDGSASTLCIFCQAQQETAEHVLISCPQVWKVWTGLLKWWGTTWVAPNSVPNLLLWWSAVFSISRGASDHDNEKDEDLGSKRSDEEIVTQSSPKRQKVRKGVAQRAPMGS
ncbi:unnamed protein product [Camellia sinensis]